MNIRQSIGEISGVNIIDEGDNVKVVFFENGERETEQGVLIDANETAIKINGSTLLKEIDINQIIEISKID